METAFAWIVGVIVGTLAVAAALLIIGFLSFGILSPIGAIVSTASRNRRARAGQPRRLHRRIGRPALHH